MHWEALKERAGAPRDGYLQLMRETVRFMNLK